MSQKFDAKPQVIILSDEAYDRVTKIIETPSEPSPALVALMKRKLKWVKK